MKKEDTYQLKFDTYSSSDELDQEDRDLLLKALEVSEQAYAPYSGFEVGAAVLLENGEVITGTNQENVAFPSGICAERTAFYYVGTHYSSHKIKSVAVTAKSKNFEVNYPVSPCGSCRQAMYEYESNQGTPIKVIMMGESGEVRIVHSVADLLPFTFHEKGLKKY